MPNVVSSTILADLGTTIYTYRDNAASVANVGSLNEWESYLRQLASAPPNEYQAALELPREVFQGLELHVYHSSYNGSGRPSDDFSNIINEGVYSSAHYPTHYNLGINRMRTHAPSGGFTTRLTNPQIVLDVGSSFNQAYHSGLLSRHFGIHYLSLAGIIQSLEVQPPHNALTTIQAWLRDSIRDERVSIEQALSNQELLNTNGGYRAEDYTSGLTLQTRLAEDYRFLLGTQLARGTFTPGGAPPAPSAFPDDSLHSANPNAMLGNRKYNTLLKCSYPLSRYLENRTFTTISSHPTYICWKNDGKWRAIDENLIWYEWDTIISAWRTVGSASGISPHAYTLTSIPDPE